MKKIIGFTCLLIIAFAPLTTSAKDFYVEANSGKDINPGTLEEPFQTIQRAANE